MEAKNAGLDHKELPTVSVNKVYKDKGSYLIWDIFATQHMGIFHMNYEHGYWYQQKPGDSSIFQQKDHIMHKRSTNTNIRRKLLKCISKLIIWNQAGSYKKASRSC